MVRSVTGYRAATFSLGVERSLGEVQSLGGRANFLGTTALEKISFAAMGKTLRGDRQY